MQEVQAIGAGFTAILSRSARISVAQGAEDLEDGTVKVVKAFTIFRPRKTTV